MDYFAKKSKCALICIILPAVFPLSVEPPKLGSKHRHAVQKLVLTSDPQQSPPSYPHASKLFSSSQLPSPMYPGTAQPKNL